MRNSMNDHVLARLKTGRTESFWMLCLLFAAGLLLAPQLNAQNIYLSGSWTLFIGDVDLQTGPGSDLNPTYTSAADQVLIEVKYLSPQYDYLVTIHLSPVSWHSDFIFRVRRTGDGSGPGWISGGLSWMQLTGIGQDFFTVNKNRRDIPIQYQLDDVSIQVEPGTYVTDVVYTIIER